MSNLEYLRELGKGTSGSVWLAKDLGTEALRAVKLVPPSRIPSLEAYNDEARVLNELKHPNIITVFGTELGPSSGDAPNVGMYAIVMEYMNGGSLEDSLKHQDRLVLEEAIRRIAEACRGVERVHASGYVHRDIKPGNILIASTATKLSDFGLAQLLNHGAGTGGGTPYYIAPEVIESGITSARSDIYSLAVSLYELINGRDSLTWMGSIDDFARAVVRGKFPDRTEFAPFVPQSLRKVITKALNVDPLKRYSLVSDFRNALGVVPIACSWRLEQSKIESWLGMGVHGLVRVQVDVEKGALEVSRCKTAPGSFRKVTADCLFGCDSATLRKRQKEIMQRITTVGR